MNKLQANASKRWIREEASEFSIDDFSIIQTYDSMSTLSDGAIFTSLLSFVQK